jgi:trans-4-hydroxy-L-proline dehydratase
MRLRDESCAAQPCISHERALLVTEFYRSTDSKRLSEPVRRALSFAYILDRREIYIGTDELIVGEKGNLPKAVPTYPELCCHSLEDLDILDSREKIPYRVSQETKDIFRSEIIPFWRGRTMREKIFARMEVPWLESFLAGVFTEFMEQRSPGHTVLDGKIYMKGIREFRADIAESLQKLDAHETRRMEELKAMDICAEAIVRFACRHADHALKMAGNEVSQLRRDELEEIARICRIVPLNAPSTFREAIQYYWFVHLGVTTELNPWDSFSPGKLDQHLLPFYKDDLGDDRLNKAEAEELLQCLWIKFNNQPAPPKVGVTAKESSTYTDFAQINTGGIGPSGESAVSELSYMIIDVAQEMRLLQPSLSVQIAEATENTFLERALEMIATGFGQPSIFNADMIVKELKRQGKTPEDAMLGGSSGCVEVGVFGRENYNLSGYFNLVKILEITLNRGIDPSTGIRLGPDTGNPEDFDSVDQLLSAYQIQFNHFADIKIRGNAVIENLFAEEMPAPFLSLLIDDCISKGMDYHEGGARYNTTYIQCVGLGSLLDSVSAIEHHVFCPDGLPMREFLEKLSSNFLDDEVLRMKLRTRTPRYGNDDERVDRFIETIENICLNAIDGRQNERGGTYHINFLPTTVHVYFGAVTGATPDGRRAGMPLSEGISPVQGMDSEGPAAVLNSASKLDHSLTGGTLLNQKFIPSMLETENSRKKLASLIRTYFRMGGHHIQLNVVDRETLLAAQNDPDSYSSLIVRVAGYSDYFCDLSMELQNEIIKRTAHGCE